MVSRSILAYEAFSQRKVQIKEIEVRFPTNSYFNNRKNDQKKSSRYVLYKNIAIAPSWLQ